MINCFWVSGQYKGNGHAKALLQSATRDAKAQGKNGLVAVVGTKKFHFMSDANWLLSQGFETVEKLPNGFSLLVLKINATPPNPYFKESVKSGECEQKEGLGGLLYQPLPVYRLLCERSFMGVSTGEEYSFNDYKVGDNGAGTSCTCTNHYIFGRLDNNLKPM